MKLLMSTEKDQFKMYLSSDLKDRLQELADRYGRYSKQSLVEEVVTIYLPLWKAVQEANERSVRYQTERYTTQNEAVIRSGSDKVVTTNSPTEDKLTLETKEKKKIAK